MSAFVVEDHVINKVITKLIYDRNGEFLKRRVLEHGYDLDTMAGRTKLGWDMFSLNIRAVNMRYKDHPAEKFRPLNYRFVIDGNLSRAAVIKALQCWMYQCTEGDCDESPLYKLMDEILKYWALDIVRSTPEYQSAAWG